MIIYYAFGSGLGHLTRARAVLHTLGLEDKAIILTNSKYANRQDVTGAIPTISVSEGGSYTAETCDQMMKEIAERNPERIFIDAFPCGLFGEFTAEMQQEFFPKAEITHIARILRWQNYQELLPPNPLKIADTLLLEHLAEPHLKFIKAVSARVQLLNSLEYPSNPPAVVPFSTNEPFWLIVHSGPSHEVQELLDYALEMRLMEKSSVRLVLATNCPPQGSLPEFVECTAQYPINFAFPLAERIVTACGFNTMRQVEPFHSKHRFMPFERRFDDQFARARERSNVRCRDEAMHLQSCGRLPKG